MAVPVKPRWHQTSSCGPVPAAGCQNRPRDGVSMPVCSVSEARIQSALSTSPYWPVAIIARSDIKAGPHITSDHVIVVDSIAKNLQTLK